MDQVANLLELRFHVSLHRRGPFFQLLLFLRDTSDTPKFQRRGIQCRRIPTQDRHTRGIDVRATHLGRLDRLAALDGQEVNP